MVRLLQINVVANSGSHGRIVEEIGRLAIDRGWESYVAYGRYAKTSSSHLVRIGNMWDERLHAIESRLLDNHGLASKHATRVLIEKIISIQPDIIHLHNIHGYYINYPILFQFLVAYNKPVVWTLHDCWPFTGHCTHFEYERCYKWKVFCHDCQFKNVYPSSLFLERSKRNYEFKKKYFTSLDNLTLIPVSDWLGGHLKESFLRNQKIQVVHNGIDINTFKPIDVNREEDRFELLGVASNWKMRKGLPDIIELRKILPSNYHITIIGLSKKEIVNLPIGITGVERTNNVEELVHYYNKADVLVNPTYEDNFPTINLEALACGTPVITYRTGGSPEAVDDKTGLVIDQGKVMDLANGVEMICTEPNKYERRMLCRERAERLYNQKDCYKAYIELYKSLIKGDEGINSNSNI